MPEHVPALPLEARAAPPPDDPVAARLRGFGPVGLLAILVIVLTSVIKPLSAILVLVWAWRSHTPWREIGYVRPKSWLGSLAAGIVFGCAFKLLMKAIVMPLLGAPAINPAYHYLAGNRAALPGMVFIIIVGAGFGEETIFRGYLFERLGKLFGAGAGAKVSIVLLTSALFAQGQGGPTNRCCRQLRKHSRAGRLHYAMHSMSPNPPTGGQPLQPQQHDEGQPHDSKGLGDPTG